MYCASSSTAEASGTPTSTKTKGNFVTFCYLNVMAVPNLVIKKGASLSHVFFFTHYFVRNEVFKKLFKQGKYVKIMSIHHHLCIIFFRYRKKLIKQYMGHVRIFTTYVITRLV